MIKVLHMFTTLDGGGVESFLFNYYSNMHNKDVKFDFIVPSKNIGFMENDLKKMGADIFHITSFSENKIKHFKEVSQIVKCGNYDIVHCHGYKSVVGLIVAKKYKVNVRIIHSHMAFVMENTFSMIYRKLVTKLAITLSTHKFACGIDAAKWLFGDKEYERGSVKIINNAIDLDKYTFDIKKRIKLKNELGLNNEIVLGNVARLTYQKNQEFLIKIIDELRKKTQNFKLLIVGDGEDRIMLENKCRDLGLDKYIVFLGVRSDVQDLLSVMDIFLLPSRFEGLPVILAEVQATGLHSVVSNTITDEIDITSNMKYLGICDSEMEWAEYINEYIDNVYLSDRKIKAEKMTRGKYDIKHQSERLYNIYKKIVSNEGEIIND